MGIANGRFFRLLAEQNAYWNSARQEIARNNLRMLALASNAGFCILLLLLFTRLLLGFPYGGPALLLVPLLTGFSLFSMLYGRKRPPHADAVTAACALFALAVTAPLLPGAIEGAPAGPVCLALVLAVLPTLFFFPLPYTAAYLMLFAAVWLLLALRISPEAAGTGVFTVVCTLLLSGAGLVALLANRMREVRLQNRFLTQSRADPLCPALLNKAAFEETCRAALCDPRMHGCALLIADLDSFKAVNDRFGHLAGDNVLGAMAAVLLRHVREGDSVCRFGGDEFCILFTGLGDEVLLFRRADAIRAAFSDAAEGAVPVPVTCSIGAAACKASYGVPYEALFSAADEALYRAKERGRNCAEVASFPPGDVPV